MGSNNRISTRIRLRMGYMSDDEYYEEETLSRRSNTSVKGEEAFAKKKSGLKKSELDVQLKEYIGEWKRNREQEEVELQRMKDKQLKRKEVRAEQERRLAQQKKDEEDLKRKEEYEKKAAEADEKKKMLEAAESKRQAMMETQKNNPRQKAVGGSSAHEQNNIRREMSKTKEQLEEEKKIALSIRIKPIDFELLDSDELRAKASELFEVIVKLETDKYDYEQRSVTQDYELRELRERQKVQLRQKAVKKGLDPEAFTGKHPPKIRMYSKYERRTDTRTYEDRQKLYEGGWEVLHAENMEDCWRDKYEEWNKRTKSKLPKWFGERPGRKTGEPDSPDCEEEYVDNNCDEEEESYDEEEYDEEEYEEEEDEE